MFSRNSNETYKIKTRANQEVVFNRTRNIHKTIALGMQQMYGFRFLITQRWERERFNARYEFVIDPEEAEEEEEYADDESKYEEQIYVNTSSKKTTGKKKQQDAIERAKFIKKHNASGMKKAEKTEMTNDALALCHLAESDDTPPFVNDVDFKKLTERFPSVNLERKAAQRYGAQLLSAKRTKKMMDMN